MSSNIKNETRIVQVRKKRKINVPAPIKSKTAKIAKSTQQVPPQSIIEPDTIQDKPGTNKFEAREFSKPELKDSCSPEYPTISLHEESDETPNNSKTTPSTLQNQDAVVTKPPKTPRKENPESFIKNTVLLRIKQVQARTSLSRSTIYDKINPKSPRFDPSFPRRIEIGPGAVGWVEIEIQEWIESRINASRNQTFAPTNTD